MVTILSYFLVGLIGFIIGFLFHIFKTNYWLIKHGINPKEFFENGTGRIQEHQ